MESDFKVYPKSLQEKDYWGQVKRTVNGQPVSSEQIAMIVDAICNNLEISEKGNDVLLDLGCGNGALSQMIFDRLKAFLGVDYSDYLVCIAQRDFEVMPNFQFMVSDVIEYLLAEKEPERFTKVLCYGCFSYFPAAEDLLSILNSRFQNVSHIFIGNLPDLDRVSFFYKEGIPEPAELRDYESKIGVWRTWDEFSELSVRAGWSARIHLMPKEFYASHYRYDVVLMRESLC